LQNIARKNGLVQSWSCNLTSYDGESNEQERTASPNKGPAGMFLFYNIAFFLLMPFFSLGLDPFANLDQ